MNFRPLDAHPSKISVSRLVLVPFATSLTVVPLDSDGSPVLAKWKRRTGENYLYGSYIAPLEQCGVRIQDFHPFAAADVEDGLLVVGWVNGELREFAGDRTVASAKEIAERFRDHGDEESARLVEWAEESFQNRTEDSYHEDSRVLLEDAYLNSVTIEGGSGHGGDRESWIIGRRLHVEAIRTDGTMLDTGCANGLLMESMVEWAAEEGYRIEPYGLDISEGMAESARRRLPHWADRIWVGNVVQWNPPFKFDYVLTRLEYVPEWRRRELVERLLEEFVARDGRLVITSYGLSSDPKLAPLSVGDHLRRWGYEPAGEPTSFEPKRNRIHKIAYVNL